MRSIRNPFSNPSIRHAAMLSLLAALTVLLAFQIRVPMKIDLGGEDQTYHSGFYYVQRANDLAYRWARGKATVTFPDTGKATPLAVTILANAWRDATRVYTATVTANGHAIGTIERAGWRTWRFVVSDPAILRADELIIGFDATPFVPADLSSETDDDRELGVAVASVEVTPQWSVPTSLEGWGNLVTIPAPTQWLFVTLCVPALYLLSRFLGLRTRWAFALGIAAIIGWAIGIAFFRIAASQRVLILTLTVGATALAQTGLDARADTSARTRASPLGKLIVPACIVAVAFLLRLHAMAIFPVEGDDGLYMQVAEQYARAMASVDWREVIAFDGVIEHPRLFVLLFASGLIVRDFLGIALSNVVTMRLVAIVFGALQTGLIALLNPLAGWFLAIQTTEIKFTSMAYLEALPALTAALSVIAFERFRRTSRDAWMYLSAIALGATGASKFIYVTAGLAILPFLLWELRRQPKKIIAYGLLAAFAFFALDPYLWYDPVGRLREMFSFHSSFSTREYVKELNRPWWYNLAALTESAKLYKQPFEYPPPFLLVWDRLIFLVGLAGLASLTRRSRLYLVWLLCGVVFISIWEAKWEQYAMVIATPLCLAAGYGIADGFGWLQRRWRKEMGFESNDDR